MLVGRGELGTLGGDKTEERKIGQALTPRDKSGEGGGGFLVMINWQRFGILEILREEELEKWEKLFNFAERFIAEGSLREDHVNFGHMN